MWYNLIRECFGHRKKYVQYASRRYLACGENTHTLRLTSKLVDLRAGYAKWIRRAKLAEPHRMELHNYDARLCIIIMERYRSGHNGADSKSVCANAHEGSNPSLSAIKITSGFLPLVIFISERDSNGCAMNDSPVRLSERTLTEPAGESESLSPPFKAEIVRFRPFILIFEQICDIIYVI